MKRSMQTRKLNNTGFTLVEMIVVMIIMVILLSLSVAGIMAWQDWSKMKQLNANAESIFIAAQTQLSDYSASGALDREVIEVIQESEAAVYFTENGADGSLSISEITDPEGNPYVWNEVWSSGNSEEYQGKIVSVSSKPGDYEKFLKAEDLDSGTALLFKLVTSYIYDKSILNNGAIVLEFSPDAAQVLAVCYSGSANSLGYGDGAEVAVNDRRETVRNELALGYYGVNTLSKPIRGKTDSTLDIEAGAFELRNEEIFDALYAPKNPEDVFAADKDLTFTLNFYDPQKGDNKTQQKVMSLEFDMKAGGNLPVGKSLSQGSGARAMKATYYNGGSAVDTDEISFRVPVWVEFSSKGDRVIRIALDAADIQAQSVTYAMALGLEPGDVKTAEEAFRKTYSFYRFGLDADRVYLGLVIRDNAADTVSESEEIFSCSKGEPSPNYEGEYVSFASVQRDDSTGNTTYEINNARHLYNIRFAEDYAGEINVTGSGNASELKNNIDWHRSYRRSYKLTKDIDWRSFVAYQYRGSNAGDNYLFNSFDVSVDPNSDNKIVYSGIGLAGIETETVEFPAFRQLYAGDSFSAYKDDTDNYSISDLIITTDANERFGLYGEDDRKTNAFSGGGNTASYDAQELKRAQGEHPTGLFAYNYGELSGLTLEKHKVFGAYKVGGFVGENFGTLKDLTLKNESNTSGEIDKVEAAMVKRLVAIRLLVPYFYNTNKYSDVYYYCVDYGNRNNDDADMSDYLTEQLYKKNSSFVCGIQDVGGICGYQKYITAGKGTTQVYDSLVNEAQVCAQMYVGGIIGRSIVKFGDPPTDRYTVADDVSSLGKTESVMFTANINSGRIQAFPIYDIEGFEWDPRDISGSKGKANVRVSYYLGGICGMACDNSSVDTFDETNPSISFTECRSAWTYSDEEIDRLISGKAGDVDPMFTEMRGSYYGGLCGFARLAYFDRCSTVSESGNAYIFGENYVGGFCGGAQLCGFNSAEGEKSTNAINVIAKLGAGGFVAILGNQYALPLKPSEDQLYVYQYQPEKHGIQNPSETNKDNKVCDLLNTGLTYATGSNSTDPGRLESKAWCGGIAGYNGEWIMDCDSLLTGYAKEQMLKLITMADDSNRCVADYAGGLVGYNTYRVNSDTEGVSYINTIVYGRNYVGGAVGASHVSGTDARRRSVLNCYLVDSDETIDYARESLSSFKGSYIRATRDYAGGICGYIKVSGILNNVDNEMSGDFVVHSDNYAGGFVGFVEGLQGNVQSQYSGAVVARDGGLQRIVADGCFAGGFAGAVQQQYNFKDNPSSYRSAKSGVTEVSAKYFAGGLVGAATIEKTNMSWNNSTQWLADPELYSVNNPQMKITADAVSGGYYGFYQVSDTFLQSGIRNLYAAVKDCNDPVQLINILNAYSDGTSAADYKDNNRTTSDGNTVNNLKMQELTVSYGTVTAQLAAGGLFGFVPDAQSIYISHGNYGSVICTGAAEIDDKYAYAGGIVGRVGHRMVLEQCENYGSVESNSAYYGALAEINYGTIGGCAVGNANPDKAYTYVGGLCGRNEGVIGQVGTAMFSAFGDPQIANVSGGEYTGGLCGENAGVIKLSDDFYYPISVAGNGYSGGICGINLKDCAITSDEDGAKSSDSTDQVAVTGNYAALIAGLNQGSINGITVSARVKAIPHGSTASGIFAGVNEGNISGCVNEAGISIGSGAAAGIAGEARNGAAFYDIINKGNINTSDNAAGIVAIINGDGVSIEKCRNYGMSSSEHFYGITSAKAGTISSCLEAGGSVKAESNVYYDADNANNNYLIYGKITDTTHDIEKELSDDAGTYNAPVGGEYIIEFWYKDDEGEKVSLSAGNTITLSKNEELPLSVNGITERLWPEGNDDIAAAINEGHRFYITITAPATEYKWDQALIRLSSFRESDGKYSLYAIVGGRPYYTDLNGLLVDPADYEGNANARIEQIEELYKDKLQNR